VCDNYGTHETPEIQAWLARHPRFHMHFTPTGSSWINQVEWWAAAHSQKAPRHAGGASPFDGGQRWVTVTHGCATDAITL